MWRRGDGWKYSGFETLEFGCTKRLHVYDYNRNIDKRSTRPLDVIVNEWIRDCRCVLIQCTTNRVQEGGGNVTVQDDNPILERQWTRVRRLHTSAEVADLSNITDGRHQWLGSETDTRCGVLDMTDDRGISQGPYGRAVKKYTCLSQ